jgi:PilZ domain-containing protein
MRDRRNKKRHSDNRRNNKRVYADLDVTTYINDEEYITKMRNISGNGIQIVKPSDIAIHPEQDCQILIQDNNTSIKLDASIVWIDFGLIGLCFKKQDQRIQKQLNKLSEKLSLSTIPIVDVAELI